MILRILGFFSSSFSRKIHHPWLLLFVHCIAELAVDDQLRHTSKPSSIGTLGSVPQSLHMRPMQFVRSVERHIHKTRQCCTHRLLWPWWKFHTIDPGSICRPAHSCHRWIITTKSNNPPSYWLSLIDTCRHHIRVIYCHGNILRPLSGTSSPSSWTQCPI